MVRLIGLIGFGALLIPGAALAQNIEQEPAKPPMMAKDADPDWEVVTVRTSDPDGTQYGFQLHGREINLYRRTVEQLLVFSYGLHDNQLANIPEWARHEEWDVKGVPDISGKLSVRQYKGIVRKVLTERFGMKAHIEQREMAVFVLVRDREGLKIVKSARPSDEPADESEDANGGQVSMHAVNMSMGELAEWMNFSADKPVIDRTGLTGRYDLALKWTEDEMRAPAESNTSPGLLTAVQEQLGLKLEATRASAELLVIDQMERPGTN